MPDQPTPTSSNESLSVRSTIGELEDESVSQRLWARGLIRCSRELREPLEVVEDSLGDGALLQWVRDSQREDSGEQGQEGDHIQKSDVVVGAMFRG